VDSNTAKDLIKGTFNFPFEESRFRNFAINLLNTLDEEKSFGYISGNYIKDKFKDHITKYRRLGTYTDPSDAKIDVLVVQIKNEWALERSRSTLRNFVADYLSNRDSKDAALVAYFSSDPDDWRFSYIRMEYKLGTSTSGKVTVRKDITPAKRFSFLVGKNEPNHTAQAQLLPILEDDHHNPTLSSLESAFSVDKVTKQFYQDYRGLYEKIKAELDGILSSEVKIEREFKGKSLTTANFSKKLLGQIVFLYFLQKKGWLGVGKNRDGNFKKWGQGPKNFLRKLLDKQFIDYKNFFNDILEPLFYEALATERPENVYSRFNCKIPFLNGGLFEPLNEYNWVETDIKMDNYLFEEIFKTFDRYNFTVREDEPLETEVAVDPEMLGKVFENLIDENERKGKGAFYTPRTIVHYMCQESLINYLESECDHIPRRDIETLIRDGDIILELEAAVEQGTNYQSVLMESIKESASKLDIALCKIKVCDPAIGSGAFPVGMLGEIVKARQVLQLYTHNSESVYDLKRHSIQNSLYGVDIDPGAIEIAKLRLWLSLVVDENDYSIIQPLPNLDYKIMQGNSLIEQFSGISLKIGLDADKQLNAFFGGEDLDKLIRNLHERQHEYFNAEHPKDKTQKREKVEQAIFEIFHSELKKKKTISQKEVENIEENLHEMTHGNKIRTFFPWELYFADVYKEVGGFDIVIANPPYVTIGGKEDNYKTLNELDILKKVYKSYSYKPNYFGLFIELAIKILNSNGNLTFIVPRTLLDNYHMEILRGILLDKTNILKLIELKYKVFDNAETGGNLVFMCQKRSTGDRAISTEVKYKVLPEIADFYDIQFDKILQEEFLENERKRFLLSGKDSLALYKKIVNQSVPLFQICDIKNGVNTGNAAKILLSREKHGDKYQKILEGKNIKRYGIEWGGLYINYDPELKKSIDLSMLETRQNKIDFSLRSKEIFTTKKIILRQTAANPIAAIDEEGFITRHSTHLVLLKSKDYYLKYILAILNSKLMSFVYSQVVPEEGKVFPEVKIVNLKKLPVKHIPLEEQELIIKWVDDLSILSSNQIYEKRQIESQIDSQLYDIFGLSESEVGIIERQA
jgi:hypothetical protein